MMFKPEIVWHYYGRLRDVLINAACSTLTPIIKSADLPRVVLIPTTSADVMRDLVGSAGSGRDLRVESGTAQSLNHYLKASADRVVWLPAKGTTDLVAECHSLERIARKRRRSCAVLPAPRLAVSEVLRLVDEAPSALLDGSHPAERRLPERLATLPEPLGPLVCAAWSELQGTTDLSLLSRAAFEERLAQLHPSVVNAPPWSAVVGLWRRILRGMEEDKAFAQKWIQKVKSQADDGYVGLAELGSVSIYEQSIFSSHALKEPSRLSYPALFYGHYWMLERQAMAQFGSLVAGSLGLSSGYGGSASEAG